MSVTLSAAEARRIALRAQGFSPRGKRGHLLRVVTQLGVLQMDSVNVLVRAHYMPLFSRMGPYPREKLEAAAYRSPRRLFEYWGHEASLLPVELQPFFRWRMAAAADHAWGRMRRIAREQPAVVQAVLDRVRDSGPLAASDLEQKRQRPAGKWWDWHDGKVALEWLFWSGQVTTAERRGFERVYDLPERVLPSAVLQAPTPDVATSHRELMTRSARAMGVATERDLRDYYRLSLQGARQALRELVEAGDLIPTRVEGWAQPAYLARGVRSRGAVTARALLSPFDSLIWHRPRTERLFGFKFRLEIYTPAALRQHGYYVLPFLLGDRLVARVDLKADRPAQTLRVQASHLEPGADKQEVAEALMQELRSLGEWLGLSTVTVAARGNLARSLRQRG